MRFRRHQPRGMNWTGWLEPLTARLRRLAGLPTRGKLVVSLISFGGAFVLGYAVAALVLFPAPILASNVPVPRLLGMDRSAALEALALLEGRGQCYPEPREGREFYVFPGLEETKVVRRCAYCGNEFSVKTPLHKCPDCGGELELARE